MSDQPKRNSPENGLTGKSPGLPITGKRLGRLQTERPYSVTARTSLRGRQTSAAICSEPIPVSGRRAAKVHRRCVRTRKGAALGRRSTVADWSAGAATSNSSLVRNYAIFRSKTADRRRSWSEERAPAMISPSVPVMATASRLDEDNEESQRLPTRRHGSRNHERPERNSPATSSRQAERAEHSATLYLG
jgi:hypothetical protein